MEYPPRYPQRSNSETSAAIYLNSSEYQPNFKAHWPDNMYSQQQLQSKKHPLGGSFDENKQNQTFGKIYSTNQSLSVDSMPRREGFWQNLTKSATNLLGKHLNSTGTILKNWSSMNTPLSVTVVSPDLYKSLQGNKDQQMITPSQGILTNSAWFKESIQASDEGFVPNLFYDTEIMNDGTKKDTDSSDSEKRWNEYKCMYINCNDVKAKDQDVVDSVNNSHTKDQDFDVIDHVKGMDNSANFGNTLRVDDEPVMLEKPDNMESETQQQQNPEDSKPSSGMVSALLNTYNKVVNGNLLGPRSTSPESSLFTKRACSPKLRLKKVNSVSVGRGRGRAKSQLRRSGVSQKRHRKERGRHAVEKDIKSDMESWEEVDCQSSTDEEQFEDIDECDFVKPAAPSVDVNEKMCPPKKIEWSESDSSSSEEEEDDEEEEEEEEDSSEDEVEECGEKSSFRSRLNSCNSEDSYCIVFDENASVEASEAESDETESESEIEDGAKKVRFNLKPTVHRMIAWSFAYKAARRNPEFADAEHFRCRIARTARILNPILNQQFRDRIYHERFEE